MHGLQQLSFPLALAGWLRFSGVNCTDAEVSDALALLVKSNATEKSLKRCTVGLAQEINPAINPKSQEMGELAQFCTSVVIGYLLDQTPVVPSDEFSPSAETE